MSGGLEAYNNIPKAPTDERTKLHWDQGEWNQCPFCGCEKFLAGPEGCGSANFKCSSCGATFNDMWRFGVDLIGWPEKSPMQLRS